MAHFLQLDSTSQRFHNIPKQYHQPGTMSLMRDISYFNPKIVLELIYLVQKFYFNK